LVAYATDGTADTARYSELRRALKNNPVTAKLLPDFVTSCRDLSQFWAFIKTKYGTYAERREYLWNAFRPLLDLLEEAPALPPGPATFWTPSSFRLFISHVAAHKGRAEALKVALKPHSISAFVAHSDIEPTAEWLREIEAGLASCDALLALLTPDFHESKWTDQEVGVVFGRGKLILPLRVGQDPYGFVGQFQGLSAKGRKLQEIVPDILRILARHTRTRRPFSDALVTALEQSESWDAAKRATSDLELFTSVDSDLRGRIVRAIDDNSEVADAHTVPERLRALCERAAT
jgi:hypothetical protein